MSGVNGEGHCVPGITGNPSHRHAPKQPESRVSIVCAAVQSFHGGGEKFPPEASMEGRRREAGASPTLACA